jgi:hypothetical protein
LKSLRRGELSDVEVFLEDLRHHSRTSPSSDTRFFDRLNGLSVGPLRAFVSGSCLVQELDTLLTMFFDGQVGLSVWQRSLDLVGENCLDLAGIHPTGCSPTNQKSFPSTIGVGVIKLSMKKCGWKE